MSNRCGNYATFDCPRLKVKEAFEWLDYELEMLDEDCYVVKVMNKKDSILYPSFEVFMPEEYTYVHYEEDKIGIKDCERCIKKLNLLEQKYYKKFNKYL